MRANELLQMLKQFHPDSQVDIYNVIPTPEGRDKYIKLKVDKLYLEDDGAVITVELRAMGIRE